MGYRQTKKIQRRLEQAQSYDEWLETARAWDKKSGLDIWQRKEASKFYDHHLIRSRLVELQNLRTHSDDETLLYTLNEGIHGNLGGMGKPILYNKALSGTKTLINDYIDELVSALQHIHQSKNPHIQLKDKLDFFQRASQCIGRSALMLSGGATQGVFHMGVVKTLFEQNLLPKVISGSSAGSIMASILATHSDEQLKDVLSQDSLRIEAMKFVGWSDIFKGIPVMDGNHLEQALAEHVPDMSFAEAFAVSGRHLNVTISPVEARQESRLLNAITSPNVYIRKGVLASCAVPGIFPPVTLEAKTRQGQRQAYNPSRQWIDGSLSDDLPAKRLARLYGVNHSIASQINPHVVPFLSEKTKKDTFTSWGSELARSTSKHIVGAVLRLSRQKQKNALIGFALTQAHALVAQDYSADIMIYPKYKFSDPRKLFSNLGDKQMLQLINAGERATWPKVELIRNCTKISRCLDDIMQDLQRQELVALDKALQSA